MQKSDEFFMRRAIELADLGQGTTNPNPLVGCVVVKNGDIISEGYHRFPGGDHAERDALLKLNLAEAKDSTIYVNLEPCCHHGKTPPCTDLIIQYGIKRVVVGLEDPNPKVDGGGISQLKSAGIEVSTGVLRAECATQNRIFLHYISTGLPFVALKYAMTLDGKIATMTGDSKWISSEASRQHVQELRQKYAGILVGIGTVLADDPMLTCRIKPEANPIRIICDHNLQIPLTSKIVQTAKDIRTIVVYSELSEKFDDISLKKEKIQNLIKSGVELLPQQGSIKLQMLMQQLAKLKIDSVLVEGGSSIHASVIEEQIADYAYVYIAPKMIGGENAPSPIGGSGIKNMSDALLLENVIYSQIENDVLVEGYFKNKF